MCFPDVFDSDKTKNFVKPKVVQTVGLVHCKQISVFLHIVVISKDSIHSAGTDYQIEISGSV